MATRKPLPNLPGQPTVLSKHARQHRARFLRFILTELATTSPWIQSELDQLVQIIQNALDALPTGEWLVNRRTHHRLCLCLAPIGSRIPLPDEDEDFYLIPANIRCSFRSDIFVRDDAKPDQSVLCGAPNSSNDNLIGGTFQFFGVPSPTEHALLYTALKLAIYAHLSLVLEQHVLTDSGVKLVFVPVNEAVRVDHVQRHKFTKSMSSGLQNSGGREPMEDRGGNKGRKKSSLNLDPININRNSLLPNGLRAFLAKRSIGSENTTPTSSVSTRAGSLDIARTTSPESGNGIAFPRSSQEDDNGSHHNYHRPSLDDTGLGNRLRQFSFASGFSGLSNWTGHGREGSTSTSQTVVTSSSTNKTTQFTTLLAKIQLQASQNAFSTSIGVEYPLPIVLVRLSERERQREAERQWDSERRPSWNSGHSSTTKPHPQPLQHDHHQQQILMGDDRIALTSLLGWVSSTVATSGEGSGTGSGFSANSAASSTTAITSTSAPPSKGMGMIGIPGFLRHQEISVLESSHVPLFSPVEKDKSKSNVAIPTVEKGKTQELPKVPAKADLGGPSGTHEHVSGTLQSTSSVTSLAATTTSSDSDASSSSVSISSTSITKDGDAAKTKSKGMDESQEKDKYNTCDQPYWRTYRFFDFPESSKHKGKDKQKETESGRDRYLGEMVEELVDNAERICWEVREEMEKEVQSSGSDGHGHGERNGSEETGGSKEKEKDREKRDKDKAKARCEAKVGRHERRYMHSDVRVSVTVRGVNEKVKEELEEGAAKEEKRTQRVIQVWESCSVCGAETEKTEMSNGAYLSSFAKYLELLVYSPLLARISTSLCEHTNAPGDLPPTSSSSVSSPTTSTTSTPNPSQLRTGTKLPEERFRIIRHFSTVSQGCSEGKKFVVSFSLSPVTEVFELRLPRLKVCKDKDHPVSMSSTPTPSNPASRINSMASEVSAWSAMSSTSGVSGMGQDGSTDPEEKTKLRKEIKRWWEGVNDHLDVLEEKTLEGEEDELRDLRKKLPRLPSEDDAYFDFDDDVSEPDSEHTVTDTPTPLAEGPTLFVTPKPESHAGGKRKSKANFGDYFNFHHNQMWKGLQPPSNSPVTPHALPRPLYQRPALLNAFRSATSLTDFVKSETHLQLPTPSTPNVQSSSTPDLSSKSQGTHKTEPSPEASNLSLASIPSSSLSTDSDATPTPRHLPSAGLKYPQKPLDKPAPELLMNLRLTFQKTEQSLYMQLAKTPVSSLNDVRRAFLSSAKGAQRRLGAWQKKHLGAKKGSLIQTKTAEPEWWDKACHVLPEGNIVIREDDWGSIIAFTLSSADYRRELANMTPNRHNGGGLLSPQYQEPPPLSSTPEAGTSIPTPSSFISAATATGYKLFRSSAVNQPDPDQEDVIWHEPESYSAVISRKDHPRDPTSLLSIREVLRQKTPATTDMNILSVSRFSSLTSLKHSRLFGSSEGKGTATPPSAWSKPEVQVIKKDVGGELSGLPSGSTDKLVHELEPLVGSGESTPVDSRPSSIAATYPDSAIQGQDSQIMTSGSMREGSLSSLDSERDARSDSTVGQGTRVEDINYAVPPALPPKDQATGTTESTGSTRSHFSTLTSGLSSAMRYVSSYNPVGDLISRPTSVASNHHGLLSTEIPPYVLENELAIMERPHIKYDWTVGKRLKFSCTVYYAKQFDNLRRNCGLEDMFLKSLSRSTNWSADGGKSKSNFWKTKDDRFIIKTLVNAWNVADLQVLIDLGPSYFRYIDSTATKATVLAKLLGFYTVEIRNLESGAVQSKADLLVMENLFYDQKIDKTFDLKGIQGRKVKGATGQTSKTLFDGEWIEGQQQSLTLVCPHSKIILREAIKSDADFLSKSNIMDYSLLLGVDSEHKQIACGLVDTIGSYTFAKTLEYKAKQGLQSAVGKEVTVVPPAEYQERFVNALERYFLACPDKWSKPLDDIVVVSNPDMLPSVL
ncbi:hypothetical protein D9758_000701 [Tetrapyrgos nigripes]|uniref:PIPK domain-containing protein n=1 Tax=Tetrapyrgos nigripes TaxID=182062 RepID=A0A8H5GZL7_9AGAR|nr:hypothetical protein D9758_000701 [Tetrapyrgos nigripes]